MLRYVAFILIFCSYFTSFCQKKYEVAQIKTPQGELIIWLYDEAPKHKASFIQLTNSGYWDTLTFNRVIPNFVAQGGCPDTPEGFTDQEMLLQPEFVSILKHEYGTFAAGRDGNPQMLSARCQFYIVQNKDGLAQLDNKFTIYGKVIHGMDIVDTIVNLPRDAKDEPLEPVTMDVNMIQLTEADLLKMGFQGYKK